VLELVAAGCGNHEIARRLVLSEKTVRNHLAAILLKLEVADRAAAVARPATPGLAAVPKDRPTPTDASPRLVPCAVSIDDRRTPLVSATGSTRPQSKAQTRSIHPRARR
jgi:Bacterial regulatory proteins, luxR family